jgi:hypothetical protein
MRLSVAERETLRKRVKFMLPQMKKSEIAKHFAKEGIAQRTVYHAIDKLQTAQPIKEKKRTGRPTTWTPAKKANLKRLVNNRTGVSQRRLGRKFAVNQSTVSRQLTKMSIPYRKREKTPKYTERQQQKAEELSGKLANDLYRSACSVILDDESYFPFAGDNIPGNAGYYTTDKRKCPESVRFHGKEKFPKKILVWIAISKRGMSEPLFRPTKSVAINSEIYIDECLEQRLLPFIHKHHPDFNYVFWPDLASAHYSKATISWMDENVNYVPKTTNPPNVPQARPIENFWGCLKQKVYDGGWKATSEEQLIRRIKSKLTEFDSSYVETLMAGVKAKVKSIATKGVFSSFKK